MTCSNVSCLIEDGVSVSHRIGPRGTMPSTRVALSRTEAASLLAAEHSSGIGGDERAAGAGGQDDDAPLIEMCQGSSANETVRPPHPCESWSRAAWRSLRARVRLAKPDR